MKRNFFFLFLLVSSFCSAQHTLNVLVAPGTVTDNSAILLWQKQYATDCQLLKITIFSAVNYNNDGEPAPTLPTFENFVFRNIDLSAASTNEPVININGFKDPSHRLKNVVFENIVLPEGAKVEINDAQGVSFKGVKTAVGEKPLYAVNNSSNVVY